VGDIGVSKVVANYSYAAEVTYKIPNPAA